MYVNQTFTTPFFLFVHEVFVIVSKHLSFVVSCKVAHKIDIADSLYLLKEKDCIIISLPLPLSLSHIYI